MNIFNIFKTDNDRWTREKLANKCFEASLHIVERYFDGFITKEELLQNMKANCTHEGRGETTWRVVR